jgi:hypothetical protein
VTVTAVDSAVPPWRRSTSRSREPDGPALVAPIGKLVVDEDAALDFTVPRGTFRDVDASDELKYIATLDKGAALPAWLRVDGSTGRFPGTPSNGDVGSYRVHVFAIDRAGAVAEDVFSCGREHNDAPTLELPLADRRPGRHPFLFEVPRTFADIDRAALDLDAMLATARHCRVARLRSGDRQLHRDGATVDVSSYLVRVTATDAAALDPTLPHHRRGRSRRARHLGRRCIARRRR